MDTLKQHALDLAHSLGFAIGYACGKAIAHPERFVVVLLLTLATVELALKGF